MGFLAWSRVTGVCADRFALVIAVWSRDHSCFLEVCEDGEDAPVVMGPGWEVELCEDVADVRLHGLGSQPQVLADAPIGEPLGE